MSLIAGSYERFIWGFKLKSPKDIQSLDLIPLFSFPSHLSTIKCADVSGSAAVSGGSDDTIKIYDLSTCSEIGSLHESATINSLAFYTPASLSFPRNLISAADDGSVSIYDADPFVHLKTVKVHRKGINSLSIHHSGRLALSVGRDECLAMVNLVRGRRSFYCRLGKEASIVKFSETGETFYMVMDEKVSIHESEDARIVLEFNNAKRVLCVASGKGGILFTGGEDRNITAWDTKSGKVAYSIDDAHSARVKGIVVLSDNDEEYPYLVASASSDGNIRVWDLRMGGKEKSNPLAVANTKSRLTCLAGSSIKSIQRPQMGNSASNEQEDGAAE
ncbi:p21-activated protein kinase-interacting protein 1-like [Ipomoea triloba]|uniref:p21-activated protein kinase-interacting protein 1-like n=1 Tax=Ipomoea triloba TaxID=35885 RepID=UPI00125E979F|nr:p21-activated protein kinase-interacting protein 1-like [Ipomoea triloba]